jgi:hypothetical protein
MDRDEKRPPPSGQVGQRARMGFPDGAPDDQNSQNSGVNASSEIRAIGETRLTESEIGAALHRGAVACLGPDLEPYTFEDIVRCAGFNARALTVERLQTWVGYTVRLLHWGAHVRAFFGDLPYENIPQITDVHWIEVTLSTEGQLEHVCLPGPAWFRPPVLVHPKG